MFKIFVHYRPVRGEWFRGAIYIKIGRTIGIPVWYREHSSGSQTTLNSCYYQSKLPVSFPEKRFFKYSKLFFQSINFSVCSRIWVKKICDLWTNTWSRQFHGNRSEWFHGMQQLGGWCQPCQLLVEKDP